MRIAFRCVALIGFIAAVGLQADEAFDQKVQELKPKADAGDVRAMIELGNAYSVEGGGIESPADDAMLAGALEWFKKAAAKGDAEGQYLLGDLLASGRMENNYPEALKWALKSAAQGNFRGMSLAANLYEDGQLEGGANLAEAFRWRSRAAEKSDNEWDFFKLGVMYKNGTGTAADPLAAAKWLQRAAERDHSQAADELEEMRAADPQLGARLAAVAPAATKQLRAKADQGDARSQWQLANLYLEGKDGLLKDPETGLHWMEAAAQQGLAEAQDSAGNLYENGPGLKHDPVKAAQWWRKAAEQKFALGQHHLGWAYETAQGVERNKDEAAKWYRAAAEQDYIASQLALAQLHQYGGYPPKSDAVKWYLRAAAHDSESAMVSLGYIYQENEDFANSRKWFAAASAKGSSEAAARLADLAEVERAAKDPVNIRAKQAAQELAAREELARQAADKAEAVRLAAQKVQAAEAALAAAEAEKVEATERASDDVNYPGEIPAAVKGASRRLFRAAVRGDAQAQFELGQAFNQGKFEEGVEHSEPAALGWWEKSAEQGNAEASQALKAFYRARPALLRMRLAEQFNVEFETAPDLRRRKEAVEHLSREFYQIGLNEADAAEFLFGLIAPKIEARLNEAFELVASLNSVEFKGELLVRKLSPMTMTRVRTDAAKVSGNYEALRQEMAKQGNLFTRATAGDAEAAFQTAIFYFNNPVARDAPDGYKWAEKAAALGHEKAKQLLLVRGTDVYNEGVNAYKAGNKLEALRDFMLADQYGVKEGRFFVGLLYSQGVGPVKPNARKASEWLQKAADDGVPEALVMLSIGYKDGMGVAKDPQHAVLLARAAADKGFAAGMRLLGYYTLRGLGLPADENAALALFKQAAEKKDSGAMDWLTLLTTTTILEDRATLALRYAGETSSENTGTHTGSPQDWLDYAVQLGQPEARKIRARWRLRDVEITITPEMKAGFTAYEKKDFAATLQHWRPAAERGNVVAQLNVGTLYHHGQGVPQDLAEARRWYEKAGDNGLLAGYVWNWTQQNELLEQQGMAAYRARKYPESLALWEKEAQAGGALGLYHLGVYAEMSSPGLPPRDEIAALAYYRRAAALGVPKGTERANRLESRMVGTKELARGDAAMKANDPKTARAEYEKAAQLGNSAAMRHLGLLYRDGVNDKLAMEWLKKAEALGDEEAKVTLSLIEGTAPLKDPAQPGNKPDDEATAHLRQMVQNEKDSEGSAKSPAAIVGTPAPSIRDLLMQAVAARKAHHAVDAIRLFEQAANAGSTQAMTQLGLLYSDGTEMPSDNRKALLWYEKAEKLGDDTAAGLALVLREMISVDAGVEQQKRAATAEVKKKAEAGDPDAQLEYALTSQANGDKNAAFEWFVKASENPRSSEVIKKAALVQASMITLEPNGLTIVSAKEKSPASPPAAPARPLTEAELKAGAPAGDALAQYDYAQLLKKKGDTAGASQWYHQAQANPKTTGEIKKWASYATTDEDLAAKAAAAKAEREKVAGVEAVRQGMQKPKEEREKTADDYFSVYSTLALFGGSQQAIDALYAAAKIAETGSPETRYRLATVIMQGIFGTPKEPERAKALLVSSANAGFLAAKLAYAQAQLTGTLGFKQDQAKGMALLTEVLAAADQGDNEVKHGTAMILFQGVYGVPADRARAVRLLNSAAENGLRESQYELGRALITGIPPELPADPSRGVDLLRKAANQKLIQAVVVLGQVFEQGAGVPANPAEALYWYKQAADSGVDGAKAAVERVQKLVTPETKSAPIAPPKPR